MNIDPRYIVLVVTCTVHFKSQEFVVHAQSRQHAQQPDTWFHVSEALLQYSITADSFHFHLCDTHCTSLGDSTATIGASVDPSQFMDKYLPEPASMYPSLWLRLENNTDPEKCFAMSDKMVVSQTDCSNSGHCFCQRVPPQPAYLQIYSTDVWVQLPQHQVEVYVTSDKKSYHECASICATLKTPSSRLADRALASRVLASPAQQTEYLWMLQNGVPSRPSDCSITLVGDTVHFFPNFVCSLQGHCFCQANTEQVGGRSRTTIQTTQSRSTKSLHSFPTASTAHPAVMPQLLTSTTNLGQGQVITLSHAILGSTETPPNRSPALPREPGLEYECPKEPKSVFGHIKKCYRMKIIN